MIMPTLSSASTLAGRLLLAGSQQVGQQADSQQVAQSSSQVDKSSGGGLIASKIDAAASDFLWHLIEGTKGGQKQASWLEPWSLCAVTIIFFGFVRLLFGGAPYLPSRAWYALCFFIPFPFLLCRID